MFNFFAENNLIFQNQSEFRPGKAYSRSLLWVLEKMFWLENVESDICVKGASKQMPLLLKNVSQKNAAMPPMSRIGPAWRLFRLSITCYYSWNLSRFIMVWK